MLLLIGPECFSFGIDNKLRMIDVARPHTYTVLSFWIFFGMVFHAQMIDVANIKSRIGM